MGKIISIRIEDGSAEEIINSISRESEIDFSYNSQLFEKRKKVDFFIENKNTEYALEKFCEIYACKYILVKDQIVLHPLPPDEKEQKVTRYAINGIVSDSLSGESLPGATVIIKNQKKGTITNSYGYYSLTLPEGEYEIIFSFVGYRMQTIKVDLTQNLRKDVALGVNNLLLAEVIVEKEFTDPLINQEEGLIDVDPSDIQLMPEFAGENGLIKSLQSLPGIQTHSDASSFFFVRGGNKDQNHILMDEAPIYNPSHLFGIYSVIIPDVAKEINIYKSDIPIENTGRLSGMIEVTTRDGNLKDFNIEGHINPLMVRFSAESPIVKDKVSFFTSFRRSNFGWLYRRESENADLYMSDFNFKTNWQINKNHRLYVSFFNGMDNYTENNNVGNSNSGIAWHNNTFSLRWNHIFSGNWFANTTFYISDYEYNLFPGGEVTWQSGISDIGFKYDLSWYRLPDLTWRFGFSRVSHDINPGNLMGLNDFQRQFVPEVFGGKPVNTLFYTSREQSLSEKWKWKIAASLPVWTQKGPLSIQETDKFGTPTDTVFYANNENVISFFRPDLRLNTSYSFFEDTEAALSVGIYHQNLHLLSNSVSPFSSFEVWMPSGLRIKPQRSHQISASVDHWMEKPNTLFSGAIYYKTLYNQIEYTDHAQLLMNPTIESQLIFGRGKAYGIEVSLHRKKGKLQGWINYTWSRAIKEFDEINEGNPFPAFYDRPHDFSLFLAWSVSERLIFSANWIYHTGSAFTTPISFYETNGSTVPIYGDRNNDRLPDYHRLDLSLEWKIAWPKNHYNHSFTLGIYNFYNRHNPLSIYFNKTQVNYGSIVIPSNLYQNHDLETTMRYINGFIPSITYKFIIF